MQSRFVHVPCFYLFLVFQTTAPFKIPKTQASCNLMALASQQGIVDSPNSSKMSTDAREICHHHWSPYPSARHSASESSKTTFGRYKEPVHGFSDGLTICSTRISSTQVRLLFFLSLGLWAQGVCPSSLWRSLWEDRHTRAVLTASTQRDPWTQVTLWCHYIIAWIYCDSIASKHCCYVITGQSSSAYTSAVWL